MHTFILELHGERFLLAIQLRPLWRWLDGDRMFPMLFVPMLSLLHAFVYLWRNL
jgi:hypothetical protein